jgi:2-succinyl-5-enolpyruvyl-6-hydroxy-3-cyclohexene-1-carboxylate synthase
MNIELCLRVLKSITDLGAQEFCVCAGARNAPLVFLLAKAKGLKVHSFFEERSAGFFALGRAHSTQRPVVVVTTSGTAVAELLPAAIEATYQGVPLIFLTADRPQSYRNTGAPQSIEQVGIFSSYVEGVSDIQSTESAIQWQASLDRLQKWSLQKPWHLNLCLTEPLLDGIPADQLPTFQRLPVTSKQEEQNPVTLPALRKPVVIVSQLEPEQRPSVIEMLLSLKAPIYAEALSGLRGEAGLQKYFLTAAEKSLPKIFKDLGADSILRIGGVPTVRFWRDLEDKHRDLPVHVLSRLPYSGLGRGAQSHHPLANKLDTSPSEWSDLELNHVKELDFSFKAALDQLLEKFPLSEPALMDKLAQKIGTDSIYLGNSLPIREWDLVQSTMQKMRSCFANRGANGIDGQISTFLGWAQPQVSNWCVVGDLTALYDLSALWIDRILEPGSYRIVIINNKGGQIFKNMFGHPAFINSHDIQFKGWAQMWKWDYQSWSQIPTDFSNLAQKSIIEVSPNPEQTAAFWEGYKAL